MKMTRDSQRNGSQAAGDVRTFRITVFQSTVTMVRNGGYTLENGKTVHLPPDFPYENTVYFDAPPKLASPPSRRDTEIRVMQADCLDAAAVLLGKGRSPCVLNMASCYVPGGGVKKGAGAQEESMFRRIDLFRSLYQFADFGAQYGVKRRPQSYPLEKPANGIYSKGVTVFRAAEDRGCALLETPFQVSFASVPALRHPPLERIDGQYWLSAFHARLTKEKIRTILRIAGSHDSLVLSAFGCGAYRNPPQHIALLFKEVFEEPEFKGYFSEIVFAIISDPRNRPEGNLPYFQKVFP